MIEFKTQLDVNSQKTLNKLSMKKAIIIFVIFSVILIGTGILGIVLQEDKSDISAGIVLIVVGVLFTPLMLLINALGQKNLAKDNPFLQEPTKEIYRFTDESFEHLQKRGEHFMSHTKADYTYFYKVLSTPTHYFMYISNRQCHVIDKTHITQGTCQQLDEIFTRKLPVGKFKVTKR